MSDLEEYYLPATTNTPLINFDIINGTLEIRGRSIPENAVKFYESLVDILDNYILLNQGNLNVTLDLEYYNSSSSICILNILRKIKTISEQDNSAVTVTWMYEEEDEEGLIAGENFQEVSDLLFVFKKTT